MAVTTVQSSVTYTGTGSPNQVLSVPFLFLNDSSLIVTSRDSSGVETILHQGPSSPNYTVSGAGNSSGGSVYLTQAVPSDGTVSVVRTVPETQTASYTTGDRLPAQTLEDSFDKLTMMAQQTSRTNDRAIRVNSQANPLTPIPEMPLSGSYVIGASGGVLGWQTPATASLADLSVTQSKIALGAVGPNQLAGGTAPIAPGAVTSTELDDNSVVTSKILNSNVTSAKIENNAVISAKIGPGEVKTDNLETISGLVAGNYGENSKPVKVTVDAKGRITNISDDSNAELRVVMLPTQANGSHGTGGTFIFLDGSGRLRVAGRTVVPSASGADYTVSALGVGDLSNNQTGWRTVPDINPVYGTIDKIICCPQNIFVKTSGNRLYRWGNGRTGLLGNNSISLGHLGGVNLMGWTESGSIAYLLDFSCTESAFTFPAIPSSSGTEANGPADTYKSSALFVSTTKKLYGWGWAGPLGIPNPTTSNIDDTVLAPTHINTGSIFDKQVERVWTFGNWRGCSFVKCSDGTLHSCGANDSGQLGVGGTSRGNTWAQVQNSAPASGASPAGAMNDVVEMFGTAGIMAGGTNADNGTIFAIHSDGTVSSVGFNGTFVGALGQGTTVDHAETFSKITGLSDIVSISVNANQEFNNTNSTGSFGPSVIAMNSIGVLKCWGDNRDGCLGLALESGSTPTFKNIPTSPSLSKNWSKVFLAGSRASDFTTPSYENGVVFVGLDTDGVLYVGGANSPIEGRGNYARLGTAFKPIPQPMDQFYGEKLEFDDFYVSQFDARNGGITLYAKTVTGELWVVGSSNMGYCSGLPIAESRSSNPGLDGDGLPYNNVTTTLQKPNLE